MKFDEETLIEITDYVEALAESVGLSPDTIIDIDKAISKQRRKLKILNQHFVSKSEERVAVSCSTCKHSFTHKTAAPCNNCFGTYNKWEQAN